MPTANQGFAEEAPSPFLPAPTAPRFQKVEVGKAGRIVIPVAMRNALGINEGDVLMVELQGQELRVVTYAENLRRLQASLAHLIRPGLSVVDELIEERRAEGTLSDEEFRKWLIARAAKEDADRK